MKFRPCIDIHNGKVKQIVGGSLKDENSQAEENFVSEYDAGYYGALYKKYQLSGGHIILLNPCNTAEYEMDLAQAKLALQAFPGGMQIGGGITEENAEMMIAAGASHVIVTSYVFHDGVIDRERMKRLADTVGKEHLVLDLSCRKKENDYFVVTNRWQTFTEQKLNLELLQELSDYCDEYLVHAVDVEGKKAGIEEEVVKLLAEHTKLPVTYAGGVTTMEHIRLLEEIGKKKVDVTIGSALDLFGGNLPFQAVLDYFS